MIFPVICLGVILELSIAMASFGRLSMCGEMIKISHMIQFVLLNDFSSFGLIKDRFKAVCVRFARQVACLLARKGFTKNNVGNLFGMRRKV